MIVFIKDLPPEYKELALKYQREAGNPMDENIPIDAAVSDGGFYWSDKTGGFDLWSGINKGQYPGTLNYEIY